MNTKANNCLLVLILLGLFLPTLLSAQQKIQISGKIVEKGSNLPIKDVNISIRTTQFGTTSDEEGNFIFEVKPTIDMYLVFSCVGYEKKSFKIKKIDKNIENLYIELEKQDIYTDEVIMNDYSPLWIKMRSYQLNASDFEKLKYDNLEEALRYLIDMPRWEKRFASDAADYTVYVDDQLYWDSSILFELDPYSIQRVIIWVGKNNIPTKYPTILDARAKVMVIYTTEYANKVARNVIQMR